MIATARRAEVLDDLKVARTLSLNVDRDESVAAALAATGPVDVLVNNAGFGLEGAIETVPLADVRRVFETNVLGAARMIQAYVPGMRERGSGTVVNVTSTAGIAVALLGGYYSASKFALEAMSEALHLEVGHFGVRVIVIESGAIDTRFQANVVDHRERAGPVPGAGHVGAVRRRSSTVVSRRPGLSSWCRPSPTLWNRSASNCGGRWGPMLS